MRERQFQPGLRISTFDVIILFLGAVGTVALWEVVWWAGFVVAFAVGHFFLFCNVFRISRTPELVWAGAFTSLAAATITTGRPEWWITIGGSLAVTAGVLLIEIRRPDYHGVAWQRVNPQLPGDDRCGHGPVNRSDSRRLAKGPARDSSRASAGSPARVPRIGSHELPR